MHNACNCLDFVDGKKSLNFYGVLCYVATFVRDDHVMELFSWFSGAALADSWRIGMFLNLIFIIFFIKFLLFTPGKRIPFSLVVMLFLVTEFGEHETHI